MDSPARPATTLSLRLSVSIGVFVVVGSLALLVMLHRQEQHEEEAAFHAHALANAAFLERTSLPLSHQMARQLTDVSGVKVWFMHPTAGTLIGPDDSTPAAPLTALVPDGVVHRLPGGDLASAHGLASGARVFFQRASATSLGSLNRRGTWLALGAFWALSLALAAWLSRGITRPLRMLAQAVPGVGQDKALPALPSGRSDEIGLLARSLQATHEALHDERERRRSAERLALLGRMAASLAHEVRNPVTAIRLHAQLIEHAEASEAALSAQLIESEAARIESLVNQWMCFANPTPPALKPVDLAALVQHALQVLQPQADHARVQLQFQPPDSKVMVQGDASRLTQVLTNLVTNAIQAQPTGGVVALRIECASAKACLSIEDHGPGFSPAALSKLGEPFFSEREGGMGLGLAVALELVRAHGGELKAANRAPEGACVTIQLPLA